MKTAGKFHATCRKEGCSFETTVGSELEAHMKGHGRRKISVPKLPKLKPAGYTPPQTKPFVPEDLVVGATVRWTQLIETGEMYVDDETGRSRPVLERVERSGQVWSLGGPNRSAWVIPYDEIPDEAEIAVLVRQVSYALPRKPKFEHSQTYAPARRRAAA